MGRDHDRREQLQRRLARAQQAIDRAQAKHAQTLERWADRLGEPWLKDVGKPEFWAAMEVRRQEWRLRKREAKRELKARLRAEAAERQLAAEEARAAQRQLRLRARSPIEGAFEVLAAIGFGVVAALHPDPYWWLLFPGLLVGGSGARILGAHFPGRAALPPGEREPDPGPEGDPRDLRIDAACERVRAELEGGPASLRELVGNPEATLDALRKTAHGLTARERELRALVTPEAEARLAEERSQLTARFLREGDAVVRARLKEALAALEAQLRQRKEIATAADRLEAEHTRIAYTLEGVHTQLLRVRAAGAGGSEEAGAALRQGLDQLGEQLDAVAEALDAVNRGDLSPVSDVSSEPAEARPRARERS